MWAKVLLKINRRLLNPNDLAKKLGVKFGKNCKFNTKKFGSEPYLIVIGDDFYSSGNVQFVTHDGSVNVIRNLYLNYSNIDYFSKIVIGNNVFIGYGAIILPGTKIGNNVIVGAGSLVKGSLKSDSVYAGVPAKYISSIDEYIAKNKSKFIHTKNLPPKEKRKYIYSIKDQL